MPDRTPSTPDRTTGRSDELHLSYGADILEAVRRCEGEWLWTDGGLLTPNPSPVGGTWAFLRVRDGFHVPGGCARGILLAELDAPVSGNTMEMLAVVEGLESLPDGWEGTVASDSMVTLRRMLAPLSPWSGCPEILRERYHAQRRRLGALRGVLVAGHPSRAALEAGVGKDGVAVSRFNVWCDAACNRSKAEFFEFDKAIEQALVDEDLGLAVAA